MNIIERLKRIELNERFSPIARAELKIIIKDIWKLETAHKKLIKQCEPGGSSCDYGQDCY